MPPTSCSTPPRAGRTACLKGGATLRRDAAVHHPSGKSADFAGPPLPPHQAPCGPRPAERRQNALVEDARAYFAENLAHELKIDDICTALGCTRPQLQQAFRARLHRTAMEEFSAMRIEYAAQLLARGASPARSPRRWATAPARISARNSALPRGTRRPPTAAFSRGCPPGGKTGNKRQIRIKNSYCRNSAERVEYKQREASRSVRTQQYHIT